MWLDGRVFYEKLYLMPCISDMLRKDEGTGWTFCPCEEQPLQDALDTAIYTIREHPDAFWGMKYRMVRTSRP